MRTFIAFKFDKEMDQEEISRSILKVKKHYYETMKINFEVETIEYRYKNIGAVIFDSKTTPLRWKSLVYKDNKALVTYAPPPNWKKFSKSRDINNAPYELLKSVSQDKSIINDFSTPTSFCLIDEEKETLDIITDAFGFARLYEYKGENGWFWSNRSGALPILAGEEARMDKEAWEFFCSAGWFTDTTSPIEKVVRIEPGFRITVNTENYSPRVLINDGNFDKMVSPRPYKKFNAKEIAEDMLENFASFSELWSLPLSVDLSGGKDSRVCAAAVIASKTDDVQFNTIATLEKEAETAANLLQIVNLSHKHNIIRPGSVNKTRKNTLTPIRQRAEALFHYTDGDLSPVSIRSNLNPDTHFRDINKVWIQGAMGEVGKATYYGTEALYNRLLRKGEAAAFDRLKQAYSVIDGIKPELSTVREQFIFNVLNKAKIKGLTGLYKLDYYYLVERSRRWLPQSIELSRYSAFYSHKFLTQSFNLTYSEKMNLELIKDVIAELVPEWKDIPFYKRKLSDRDERTEKGLRLWQNDDREHIEEILAEPEKWNDMFDERKVIELWNNAKKGDFHPSLESLFDRLILRATFNEHLDRINSQLENPIEDVNTSKSRYFPSQELNIDENIRLVIYDKELRKFVVDEIIPTSEKYELDPNLIIKSRSLIYKYQRKKDGKWIDITNYISL